MKRFIRERRKLSKKEIIGVYVGAFILLIFTVCCLTILALRSSNTTLKNDNYALGQKANGLQDDLREISEKLSGLSVQRSKQANTEQATVLNRIGLTATGGETHLSVDTPEGWKLVGENRLINGESTVSVQAGNIDLLTISNYQVSRVIEPLTLKSGQVAFLVFIKTSADNRGYLSVSFCNPDTGVACSYRGSDGNYVFVLGHGYKEQDQFVRDMDFNTGEGIKLLTDFKTMMASLEIG